MIETDNPEKGFTQVRDVYRIEDAAFPDRMTDDDQKIDFAKESVLAIVQLGKPDFLFYDMAKFQFPGSTRKRQLLSQR